MVDEEIKKEGSPYKGSEAYHYQSYIDDYQWIEAIGRMPNFRELSNGKFFGVVEVLARKYLDRLGKKDDPVQELDKAIWYLRYLRACIKTNSVADPKNME
jgi:hypothetical protein